MPPQRDDYVELAPHESLGTEIDLPYWYRLPGPGDYELVAYYQADEPLALDVPGLLRGVARLRARPATVATVTGCCNPRGCDEFFNPRFARRMARRYRKRGLDKPSRRMVEFLEQRGELDGATVLEIGGGVGEIQLELLKRGAAKDPQPGALERV